MATSTGPGRCFRPTAALRRCARISVGPHRRRGPRTKATLGYTAARSDVEKARLRTARLVHGPRPATRIRPDPHVDKLDKTTAGAGYVSQMGARRRRDSEDGAAAVRGRAAAKYPCLRVAAGVLPTARTRRCRSSVQMVYKVSAVAVNGSKTVSEQSRRRRPRVICMPSGTLPCAACSEHLGDVYASQYRRTYTGSTQTKPVRARHPL
ncbi:hypothetical protein C8T65DRAFT_660578, partial [Cerioporus squamosus]